MVLAKHAMFVSPSSADFPTTNARARRTVSRMGTSLGRPDAGKLDREGGAAADSFAPTVDAGVLAGEDAADAVEPHSTIRPLTLEAWQVDLVERGVAWRRADHH